MFNGKLPKIKKELEHKLKNVMKIFFPKQFILVIGFTALATLSIAQTNYTLQGNDVVINNGYILNRNYDFSANPNGTNLTIPSTLQGQTVKGVIGGSWSIWGLFSGCNIVGLTLPNTFEDIGDWAFSFNNISELNIPSSVTEIGEAAFNNNAVTIINGHSTSGIIYARNSKGTNDSTRIISYGGTSKTIDFISGPVTVIDSWAFGQIQIDSILLPNTIDSVCYGAFSQNLIRNIELPTDLKFIAMNAFTDNKLSELNIPSEVNYIGFGAFGNNLLTKVTIAEGYLDTIKGRAFTNNQITEIEIPGNVKYIGFEAFFRNKLTNIVLKQGKLCAIGESVFEENLVDNFTLPEHNNTMGFNGWIDGNNNDISGPPYITSNLGTSYTAIFTSSIENDKYYMEKYQISPNPVKDRLFLKTLDNSVINKILVFNNMGIILKNEKNLYSNQIDMSMFPSGVYLIKIEDTKGGLKTFKIIKE